MKHSYREAVCEVCRASFRTRSDSRARFCSPTCVAKGRRRLIGPDHPLWKGGSLTKAGYVQVYVDGRRRLEHQVVAERKLGRPLRRGEIVHHINGVKADNDPANLEVLTTGRHVSQHSRQRADLATPDSQIPMILCACGCNTLFPKYESRGRPRQFIHGHNTRVKNPRKRAATS